MQKSEFSYLLFFCSCVSEKWLQHKNWPQRQKAANDAGNFRKQIQAAEMGSSGPAGGGGLPRDDGSGGGGGAHTQK